MRVLVTGGAGYIGSVTVAQLRDRGHEVVVVDDLRSGHAELVPEGVDVISADIAEPQAYRDALADVDACVHFAASIEAGESMRRPEAFFANNTAGTLRLLEALTDADVDRFVLSSTAAVYGDPERVPIDEDDATRPTNAYGESKLLIERSLDWLARLRGMSCVALRYFNASGATADRGEDHDPETHLIPLILQVAAGRRDDIKVFGTDYDTPDGTCVRDYVHVADLADAHVRAVEQCTDPGLLVCNLGNGDGFSVRRVIDVAREVTGHAIRATDAPRRPGDPAVLVASSDRARDRLGWRPRHVGLHDIVASAWQWHCRRWGLA
ncbi:MAG: UDP-glucose 4-epimerase GalE [Actinobacteria bacterium]|nr:UDP-glucose 4-epimerase GalE [Actinomycetota bacterium]